MLRKVERFNDIPKEYLPPLPEYGTVVKFRCIEMLKDPIMWKGKPSKQYPMELPMHMTSSYTYKDKDGNMVRAEIGMVTGVDKDTNDPITSPGYRSLFTWSPAKTGGIWRIQIGASPGTDALYQYLMMASFVGNNMNQSRDVTQPVIIEYLDEAAEAKAKMDKQNRKYKAIEMASKLERDDMYQIAYILRIPTGDRTLEEITWDVRNIAENQPDLFIQRLEDTDAPYKARIAAAMSLGIVSLDTQGKCLRMNDVGKEELLKLTATDPDSVQAQYATFINEDPKAKTIDKAIQKAIEAKLSEKQKNKPATAAV